MSGFTRYILLQLVGPFLFVTLALTGQGLWIVFAILSSLTIIWALALGISITLITWREPLDALFRRIADQGETDVRL